MKRYIVVLLSLFLGVTACAFLKPSPQQMIIGKWINSGGGEINFYKDGTGFVPGFTGEGPIEIPSLQFTYGFKDDTHLVINMANLPLADTTDLPMAKQQEIVMGIKIEDDKMTWYGAGEAEYVYTRVNN